MKEWLHDKKYLIILGFAAIAALIFYLSQINYQYPISVGDNYTYELLAQTVFSDHPFKINVKFDYYDEHEIFHHQRSFPPLWPIVLAFAHLIFGPSIYVNFIVNAFIGISLGLVIYFLGLLCLKDPFASLLAALATIFSFTLINTSIIGISEPLFTLNALLSLYFLYRHISKDDLKSLSLAALFCGLAYLTRTNGVALVLTFTLFLLFYRQPNLPRNTRFKRVGLFLSVLILVVSPWLIRNLIIFGDPFYYVGRFYAGIKPGLYTTEYYQEAPTLTRFLKNATLEEIVSRYVNKLPLIFSLIFKEGHLFFIAAFPGVWLLISKKKPSALFLLYIAVNLLFVLLFPSPLSRFFVHILPIIYLLGAAFISYLLTSFVRSKEIIVLGALVLITVLYVFLYVSPRITKNDPYSLLYKDLGLWLKENSAPQAVVMSNWTPDLAYYSGRPVISNPRNLETARLDEIVKKYQVDYFVYFRTYIPGTTAPSAFVPQRAFVANAGTEKFQLILYRNQNPFH